jgi:ABC-type amino acid transport substrate-binding protein
VTFTVPVRNLREELVVRRGDVVAEDADLAGRRVAVRNHSPLRRALQQLGARAPGLRLHTVPESLSADTILKGLATGHYDMAAVEVEALEPAEAWPDVRRVGRFSASYAKAWAVHPASQQLREALDAFLRRETLVPREETRHLQDLDGIREQRHHVLHLARRDARFRVRAAASLHAI